MSRSAEQPGSSKRQRDVLLDQVGVAYILCEDTAERLKLPDRHRALVNVLQNAVEAGAHVISLAFPKAADATAVLNNLRTTLELLTSKASVEFGFNSANVGALIIFYRNSGISLVKQMQMDPEGGLPALAMRFEVAFGGVDVVCEFWPQSLPWRVPRRILASYIERLGNPDHASVAP